MSIGSYLFQLAALLCWVTFPPMGIVLCACAGDKELRELIEKHSLHDA